MINPNQFIEEILEPTLKALDMHSEDAMYLMMRTAIVESQLTHIRQLPRGRGLGFMQVEFATYVDVLRYLRSRPDIEQKVLEYSEYVNMPIKPHNVMGNLVLNVIAARLKYWMQPAAIPDFKDIDAQARYYKVNYNTALGAATEEQFINAARQCDIWVSGRKVHERVF